MAINTPTISNHPTFNDTTVMKDANGNKLSREGFNNMFTELNDLLPKTREERSRIIEAGVPVAEEHLREVSPYLNHKYPSQKKLGSKLRSPEHLKESVTHTPNQFQDGSTNVGFTHQAEPIARWVDQGTYRQDPQYFMEYGFKTLNANEVFKREEEAYRKYLRRKGVRT